MKNTVAIVGRPNVGKSTLFNRMINQKTAVTSPVSGVTRDRIYADTEWKNKYFTLVDTGGIKTEFANKIEEETLLQAEIAIKNTDLILFVVDVHAGITVLDEIVADKIRKYNKKVIVVVNKVDDFQKHFWHEFYSLGFDIIIPVSAEHNNNLNELLDNIFDLLDDFVNNNIEFDGIKVSIIGKPNVGKSTLFNRISNENRSIISEIPGTTRDAIDVIVTYNNTKYLFVDTAGMRKKNKITDSVEYYSIIRTINSIKKTDLVILMLNADEGLWEQDLKIANTIMEYNKGIILTINKWDLVDKDDKTYKKFLDHIYDSARFLNFAPVLFISALTGKRVNKIFDLINSVYDNKIKRIKTSVLNDFLLNVRMNKNVPVLKDGVKPKMKFMNQIDKSYPSFVLYINRPDLVDISFKKFIINRMREKFDFIGVPIELKFKKY